MSVCVCVSRGPGADVSAAQALQKQFWNPHKINIELRIKLKSFLISWELATSHCKQQNTQTRGGARTNTRSTQIMSGELLRPYRLSHN